MSAVSEPPMDTTPRAEWTPRAIRCDRRFPCAHCTTINQECSFTGGSGSGSGSGSGHKPKEPHKRILISSQYERKIDHIEHGLSRIEKGLHALSQAQRRMESMIHTKPSSVTSSLLSPSVQWDTAKEQQHEDHGLDGTTSGDVAATHSSGRGAHDPALEGDSSVTAHAAFARSFVDLAVQQHRSYGAVGPRLTSALATLHQLLQTQKPKEDDHFPHEKPLGKAGLSDLHMPPLDTVLPILRELKKTVPLTFTLICALDSVEYFTEQCRKIYFATDSFTQASFIMANAGLYFIFQEKMALARHAGDEQVIADLEVHLNICRDNLETVLAHLNLLLPARKENIIALVMGASYAIEISKPSLAWRLISAACQLSLTLGYHRAANLPGESNDTKNKRAVLFWLAYILDRALALRLGRPPNVPDYEITLPRKLEPLGEFESHRETIQSWMVQAEVHGKTYEKLYSPAALAQPVEQRTKTAQTLARVLVAELEKMHENRKRREHAGIDMANGSTAVATMLSRSDELAILSTLTLIYRSVPPAPGNPSPMASKTFSSDCIKVARESMRVHLECIELVEKTPMLATAYMHWILLFSPFIPFIVLFCYVIECSDTEDVKLIERFMTSMEPWRGLSGETDKLFQLCRALNNLARVCIEASQMGGAPRPSGGWNHNGVANSFVQTDPVLHGQEQDLVPGPADQDLHMGLGAENWNWGQVQLMAGSQAHQVGDLFTEYMSLMDIPEFIAPDWLRRGPSNQGASGL